MDAFRAAGLTIFGPTAAAAQLEGSKAFTKDFLARHAIPTAEYQNFTEVEPALAYLREKGAPIVVKADGLAAGRGDRRHDPRRGGSGPRDMLSGNAFRRRRRPRGHRRVPDGKRPPSSSWSMANVLPMATSQDHKRAFDGDTGPNTGGMGLIPGARGDRKSTSA